MQAGWQRLGADGEHGEHPLCRDRMGSSCRVPAVAARGSAFATGSFPMLIFNTNARRWHFPETAQKRAFQTVTGASQSSLGAGKAYSCFWRQTGPTVILLPIPSTLEFQQQLQEEGLAPAVSLLRAFQGESSPRHGKARSRAHPLRRSTVRHL